MFSDTTSEYSTHYTNADSNPPTEARDIGECGCYITIEINDRDRVWVTYSYETTTYHLCTEHMQTHREYMKVRRGG